MKRDARTLRESRVREAALKPLAGITTAGFGAHMFGLYFLESMSIVE